MKCDDTCIVATAFLIVTIITLFIIGLVWCAIYILANHRLKKDLEMKEFQKTEEEKKRKENEEAGIELSQVLTKENLKQWIEIEGHTYAWVAREKAGCKESQIAATAQMMGIKSRITKKKALIMAGR